MTRALALVVALGLAVPVAAAPPEPARRAELRKARDHFRRGQKLHDAGRYDDAIREYETAYAISALPELLYNLGQVHRLRGDRLAAVAYYERYLAAAPMGRGAAKARSFVEVLNRELEVEIAAKRSSFVEEWRGVVQGGSPEPYLAPLAPAAPPPAIALAPEIRTRDLGGGLRLAGLVTGGAGLALVGGGIYFALRSRSLAQELDQLGEGDTYDPALVEDGRAANRNAAMLSGIGAVATVTGGILVYLGTRRAHEPELGLQPSAGGALLTASGRF